MDCFSKQELSEALRAIVSTTHKCEKAVLKLTEGTPQHTLLVRRIKALHISAALIQREADGLDQFAQEVK